MKKCKEIKKISIAGSLRRMKETIGDLDILAASEKPEEVMDFFVKYENVQRVLLKGATKTSVLLKDNLQVDLRVVEPKSFGAALQYFTGSKEHNVKMRSISIKKGYKLNEYGLFDKKTEKSIVGESEEEIYNKLGLEYIEPELRENRGEIQASAKKKLPKLVGYDDLKGELHIHSNHSDGFDSIDVIAQKAEKMGYEYIGIADHSESLKIAKGLNEKRIIKKIKEIEKINKKYKKIKILCTTECDIKADGSLDYSNEILQKFDFVGIGIHVGFKMTQEEATDRILKAMENKYVNFLAHPTCRMIGHREPIKLDFEKIFEKAVETNTLMEINSSADRLDLDDLHVKQAKDKGVKFIINTDAHAVDQLELIKFGIATARRGWLEKKDIINTNSLTDIKKQLA